MNYREPNDAGQDADRHNDEPHPLTHDIDPDAERLEQQERAAKAGCFYKAPDYLAIVKAAALQAHSDFCFTHGIGDGKRSEGATTNGHYDIQAREG